MPILNRGSWGRNRAHLLFGYTGITLDIVNRRIVIGTFLCFALCQWIGSAQQRSITIPNVRSGIARLGQRGRLTVLSITPSSGSTERIALSHPSDYRQGTNAPYQAELVAESPHHFLIFTDSFASNPGNIQGRCGAAEPGERFVHVVSLETIPHETLSVLIESCLSNIEPSGRSPEWIAKADSAGFEGRLQLSFESETQTTIVYYIAPDGAVSRPDTIQKRSE